MPTDAKPVTAEEIAAMQRATRYHAQGCSCDPCREFDEYHRWLAAIAERDAQIAELEKTVARLVAADAAIGGSP